MTAINNNRVTRTIGGLNIFLPSIFVKKIYNLNKPENPSPIRLGVFGITLNITLGFNINA